MLLPILFEGALRHVYLVTAIRPAPGNTQYVLKRVVAANSDEKMINDTFKEVYIMVSFIIFSDYCSSTDRAAGNSEGQSIYSQVCGCCLEERAQWSL